MPFLFQHLAELLSVRVGQEGFQGLEASVDALHAPPLVAVCDLAANSPLLVLSRLRTEGDVGQAEIYKNKKGQEKTRDDHHCHPGGR